MMRSISQNHFQVFSSMGGVGVVLTGQENLFNTNLDEGKAAIVDGKVVLG